MASFAIDPTEHQRHKSAGAFLALDRPTWVDQAHNQAGAYNPDALAAEIREAIEPLQSVLVSSGIVAVLAGVAAGMAFFGDSTVFGELLVVGALVSLAVAIMASRGIAWQRSMRTRRHANTREIYANNREQVDETWRKLRLGRRETLEQYRSWWRAYRRGEGGFDLALRDHLAATHSVTDAEELERQLKADAEFYREFLRLSLVPQLVGDGDDVRERDWPLVYWCRDNLAAAHAAGEPVTLREEQERDRKNREVAAAATFAEYKPDDEDAASFLAARAVDGAP